MKTNCLSNISPVNSRRSSINVINEGNLGFWDNVPIPEKSKKL